MRNEQATIPRPGMPAEPHTIVSELDGSTVTVGVQPGGSDDTQVVVMRLQSPLLDVLNAVYLLSAEARQLADTLSSAAVLVTGLATGATAAHADDPPAGKGARSTDEDSAGHEQTDSADFAQMHSADLAQMHSADLAQMHTVTVSEGASAGELRDALDTVPPHAELVDFGADADVSLIFATAPACR